MISKHEYLERIVAGIHAVTTDNADVRWNELINGRQFDVVVRFKIGTLSYLVLIEVKNRTRKADAETLDAFANKSRDQNASKAVFVTAAGFQIGAIDIAKRHAIDLFTVTFDEAAMHLPSQANYMILKKKGTPKDNPPKISLGEPKLVANIEKVTLVYSNGARQDMPDEPSQMNYYAKKTALQDGGILDDVIQKVPLGQVEQGKSHCEKIRLDPPLHIEPPDNYSFPPGELASLECVVTGRLGRPIKGNTLIEPNTIMLPVIYKNVITGETSRHTIDQLPLGPKRVSVGDFYFITHPLIYYYCAAIQNNVVRWYLIESFQNGQLVTATMEQSIKESPRYIPVSDKETIKRLKKRLDDYWKLHGNSNHNKQS